nr:AraC family transcriptional regulator ligand-binding domain-containing protein [Mycobacteroides chelonae]
MVGPDAVVSGAQELQIVRNLLALTGDPVGLGIEVGTRYQIASAGILGFALLSSPTMRDALAVGLRFSQLSSTFHRFTLTIGDADSIFDLDESDIPPDVRRFLLERDLAAIAGIVPILFSGAMPTGARVQLRSGPDTPLRLLAELLTVEFDSPRNALVFPPSCWRHRCRPPIRIRPPCVCASARSCSNNGVPVTVSPVRCATSCFESPDRCPPWAISPRACTSPSARCTVGWHARAPPIGHCSTRYARPWPKNSSPTASP